MMQVNLDRNEGEAQGQKCRKDHSPPPAPPKQVTKRINTDSTAAQWVSSAQAPVLFKGTLPPLQGSCCLADPPGSMATSPCPTQQKMHLSAHGESSCGGQAEGAAPAVSPPSPIFGAQEFSLGTWWLSGRRDLVWVPPLPHLASQCQSEFGTTNTLRVGITTLWYSPYMKPGGWGVYI